MTADTTKAFAPIRDDYAFFETHSSEAENDLKGYARSLAGLDRGRSVRVLDFGCGDGGFSAKFLTTLGVPPERLTLSLVEPDEVYRQKAVAALVPFTRHSIDAWPALPDSCVGCFDLASDGQSFTGSWRQDGQTQWQDWTGKRAAAGARAPSYDGVWDTTFGKMRLVANGDRVTGVYAFGDSSSIEGRVTGTRLDFRYTEGAVRGQGRFELAPDGRSFRGTWQADGNPATRDWTVTASLFATLNEMYGNRTVCGIGRGDSAVRVTNGKPTTIDTLRSSVHVIRELANGRSVEYKGSTITLPWAAKSRLEVWVAGYGPRALALAGERDDD